MIDPNYIIALISFYLVMYITPGPNNAMILASGIKFGFKRTIPVILGITVGHNFQLLLVCSGFGKVFKIILSQKNALGLFIPAGFAHAYYSYEKENVIYYKLDNYYSPKNEHGIRYDDKDLKIKWPKKRLIVSKKDKNLLSFQDLILLLL